MSGHVGKRIRWLMGLSMLALGGALCLASAVVLLRAFDDLEDRSIRENVGRARNAMLQVAAQINATAGDYAAWDSTYEYALTGEAAFPAAELGGASLSRLNINAIWVVNQHGKILFSKMFDESGKEGEAPASLTARIVREGPGRGLLAQPSAQSHIAGLAAAAEGPMVIACRPILKTDQTGPSRGTLIMGRFVNAGFMEQLGKLTQLSVAMGADEAAAGASAQGEIKVLKLDHSHLRASTTVPDILGGAGVVLQVDASRPIFQQGWLTIRDFGTALLLIVVVFAVAAWWLANRLWTVGQEARRMQVAKETQEHANAAKDRFLATLGHELRTPLTPALLGIQEIEADVRVPAELRQVATTVRQNIRMETQIVDDLLDVARVQWGKLKVNCRNLDLHELLRETVAMMRSQLDERQLSLTMHLDAQRSIVHGDPVRLRQVILNLLSNSIKFTPGGGGIEVRTRQEASRIVTEVCDTGVGIPEADRERIFLPFEQAGRASRPDGLGLGLAISKAVLEGMGGTISAGGNGSGAGSVLSVALPTVEAEVDAPSGQTPTAVPREGLHILLVEDNADTAVMLRRLLVRAGHRVTVAGTVGQGMKAVAEELDLDVLVSDIGLPDGSGLDLMRYVRQTGGMPGIAVSGFGTQQDREASLAAGFAIHLTKPIQLSALQEAIRQVTESTVEQVSR